MTVKGFKTNKLIDAIRTGSLSGVLNALDAGDDIEMPDMHGYSGLPLRTACFEGHLAIVRELLNRGANPDAIGSDGPGAPLRLASRKGHQDIAELLLKKGATPLDGMQSPSLVQDAQSVWLPDEVITPSETKPDNVVEFSTYDTPPPAKDLTIPLLPESKPGNLIEFSSSDTFPSTDDPEGPGHFGTDTSLLSMDLLFLEDDENPVTSPKTPNKP